LSKQACFVRRWSATNVAAIGIFALAVQLAGCGCTLADCSDGLYVHGLIGIPASEPARLHIRACRNGACGQGTLSADAVPGESTYAQKSLSGSVQAEGSLRSHPGDEHWYLSVTFGACDGEGEFEDGDVILVEVTDLDTGVLLVDMDEAVVFGTVAPNGEWCGPICLVAEIPIPAF